MRVVISSGHGKYIRGAADILDEVDEARRVVNRVAELIAEHGGQCTTFHDDVSHSQNENLHRIVDFHNSKTRDFDISVHFNAYQHTSNPMGTEVLYVSQKGFEMADQMVDEICIGSGLKNRGAKERTDLYFLNNTHMPAVLIETCFVDSSADADIYRAKFEQVCESIADVILEDSGSEHPDEPDEPEEDTPLLHVVGKCSHFGGPEDTGVSPSEGLAFIYDKMEVPELFLPYQPSGTTGLARRLNPQVPYVACRWDYSKTPKEMLKSGKKALVKANGWSVKALPADWGPHEDTGRVADLSPGLMGILLLTTDDEVEVIFPYESEI